MLAEVKADEDSPALQAVKLLAAYFSDAAGGKSKSVLMLEDWLADPRMNTNATFQLVAGTILLHESQFGGALKVLKTPGSLEHMALTVQIHLRLDRPDLAAATVKAMQGVDDESALTCISAGLLNLAQVSTEVHGIHPLLPLTNVLVCYRLVLPCTLALLRVMIPFVWLCLQGGDRTKEASLVYKELLDRFGRSLAGLNGLATAYIGMRRFDDAERALNDALETDPNDADTLANIVTLHVQAGKTGKSFVEAIARLRAAAPHHPYVEALGRAEDMFDRVAAGYGV